MAGKWLRFCDVHGNWCAQPIEQKRQKVEQERQWAERLAEKLRALGIDPDFNSLFTDGERIMKLFVTIDRDEDGVWIIECPMIPGCISQGHSKQEALENIKEAIQLCLEVRAERGLPLTIETRQIEVAA